MGRGKGIDKRMLSSSAQAAKKVSRPLIEEPLIGLDDEQAKKFLKYKKDTFSIEYITTPHRLRMARKIILGAPQHGFDIETTSFRGWGVANGSPRLLQFGIDTPETGPYQAVIDVNHVDPTPIFAALKDPGLETQIQNYDFELQWMLYHFGVKIRNPYDTKIVSAALRRTIKARFVDKEGRITDDAPNWVHQMYPKGWEKRDNRLGTICEDTLGFPIPKQGLQDGNWSAPVLPHKMIVYAGGDPAVTLSAGEVLKARADELNLLEDLKERFSTEPRKIWKRVEEHPTAKHDDSESLIMAIRRATSVAELERIRSSSRQAALYYTKRKELNNIYREKKAALMQTV